MAKINILNKKFGKLKPIEYLGDSTYRCICDCNGSDGNRGETSSRSGDLRRGMVKSCGCIKRGRPRKDTTNDES